MKNFIIKLMILLLFFTFVLYPQVVMLSAKEAIDMCLTSVIPSLFPFFVLSTLCIGSGLSDIIAKPLSKIMPTFFGVSSIGSTPLILSFISGYPIGALTISELYQNQLCSKEEANRLLLFCNNTGPAFIIGICGGVILQDIMLGFILYFIHIISALCVGIFARFTFKAKSIHCSYTQKNTSSSISIILVESIKKAVNSCLSISGFIIFFAIIISLLTELKLLINLSIILSKFFSIFNIDFSIINVLLSGMIELTSGLYLIDNLSISISSKAILCSVILSFGGFSVLLQTMSFISPLNLNVKYCILGKVIHALFAYIISSFLFRFWNFPVQTLYQFTANDLDIQIKIVNSILFLILFIFSLKIYWKKIKK